MSDTEIDLVGGKSENRWLLSSDPVPRFLGRGQTIKCCAIYIYGTDYIKYNDWYSILFKNKIKIIYLVIILLVLCNCNCCCCFN